MRSTRLAVFVSVIAAACAVCNFTCNQSTYPFVRRDMTYDFYDEHVVMNPYRYLEDLDSNDTQAFIAAQNNISAAFIDSYPQRKKLTQRLTDIMNNSKIFFLRKAGNHYYHERYSSLHNQNVMYVQDDLDFDKARKFLDPSVLSVDGNVSLSHIKEFSRDGSLIAYGLITSGPDGNVIKVKRAPSGEDLQDTVTNVRLYSVAWVNNTGFFYSVLIRKSPTGDDGPWVYEYPGPENVYKDTYFHQLGTKQSEDILQWDHSDYNDDLSIRLMTTSFDGRYQVTTRDREVYLYDLIEGSLSEGGVETYFDSDGPAEDDGILVANDKSMKFMSEIKVNGKLLLLYQNVSKYNLYIHNISTGAREHQIELPPGTVSHLSGQENDTEAFFDFTSFGVYNRIYRIDMINYETKVIRESPIDGFDPENFETHEISYNSYDGTTVSMSIFHKKGITMSGDNPTLLSGYGEMMDFPTPAFSLDSLAFVQNLEGVYGLVHAYYGSQYYPTSEEQQKMFNDLQAAAEYLINNSYTNADKIAIRGSSYGGYVVAASLNQRPGLFAAGIIQFGVLDTFRYRHYYKGYSFDRTLEYGNRYERLSRYSPIHNIPRSPEGGQYPATLLLTNKKVNSIASPHSLRFIAELQHTLKCNPNQTNPLLIRVDTNYGHGSGKSTSRTIEEEVDILSFLCKAMKLEWTDQ